MSQINGAAEEKREVSISTLSDSDYKDDAASMVIGDVCVQFLSGEQWTADIPILCDIGQLKVKLARQLDVDWSQIKMTREVAEGVFEECQNADHIMKDRLQGVSLYNVVVDSLRRLKVIENEEWRDRYERFKVIDENGKSTRYLVGSELEIPKSLGVNYIEVEYHLFLLGEPVKVVYV
jgi:hypothetical protein